MTIDLEFNREREIIQVGATFGDVSSELPPYRFSCLIFGTVHGVDDYIRDLTGITNTQLKYDGHSLPVAIQKLKDFIKYQSETAGGKPFINALTWGGNDSLTLSKAANELGYDLNFGNCVIDVKHVYRTWRLAQGKYPTGSLEVACQRLGLEFVGTPHQADWDTYNTFMVYRNLIRRFQG